MAEMTGGNTSRKVALHALSADVTVSARGKECGKAAVSGGTPTQPPSECDAPARVLERLLVSPVRDEGRAVTSIAAIESHLLGLTIFLLHLCTGSCPVSITASLLPRISASEAGNPESCPRLGREGATGRRKQRAPCGTLPVTAEVQREGWAGPLAVTGQRVQLLPPTTAEPWDPL